MDIRQLRYFIAIAEEGKITAAANKLHISQPPLSQQLKLMEEELGVELVKRNGRQLELTEAGQTLYKHALKITYLMEESQIEVKQTGSGVRGKLTIGVNTLSNHVLSKAIQQFHHQYPNITYKIQQNESAQLCKLVKERAIELAFVRLPLDLSEFSALHLEEESFYFVASKPVSPLANELTYEQVSPYPLILPSAEGLGVYHMIVDEFARLQLKANVICECSDIAMLLELVSSGFAATIIPEIVLKMHRGHQLNVYELSGSKLAASSGLIWLKNHHLSKAAQNFITHFKETLSNQA